MKGRRISPAAFDRGVAISRMNEKSLTMARAILVDGQSQVSVARAHGLKKQWISELVNKMRNYIDAAEPVPEGWTADTVVLPPDEWPKVRRIESRAKVALQKNTRKRG